MERGRVSLKVRNHLVEDLGGPTAGDQLACWPGPLSLSLTPDIIMFVCSGPWPCAEYEQVRLCLDLHGAFEHLPAGAFAGNFTHFAVIRA